MRTRACTGVLLAGLSAAAIAGCGVAAGSPATHSSAVPSHHRSHERILTVRDNGARIRLRVGQSVVVLLTAHGLMWDIPRAYGKAVRRIRASGGYPTTRPARGVFRAVRPGTATLTSVTDARCLHVKPRCLIAQELWRVVVVVSRR